MYDAPSFFVHHYTNLFIFFKLQSFEDFFDYVLSASKNSSCKLLKQYSQPVHTFFSHFCTYLFYIEGNGKEGKVHGEFVLSKMSETFIVHIVLPKKHKCTNSYYTNRWLLYTAYRRSVIYISRQAL